MPRRPRPAATARDQGGAARPASPFKALGALKADPPRADPPKARAPAPAKGKVQTSAAKSRTASPPEAEDATADAADADDLALFRQTVAGVAPLGKQDRAQIDTPRPPPIPRTRPAESAESAAPGRPRSGDALSTAYADVIPLAASGRVELATPARYRERAPADDPVTDKSAHPDGDLPAVVLPADADVADPATLFRLATRGARPLDSGGRAELNTAAPAPAPLKREADERDALHESLTAPLTFEDRLDMGDEAAFLRPGLPRRVLSDLRRGRWVLQGEIDLHGLTRDQARDALARFLHASLTQGKRCIRVIHGKGLGSPGRVAILKQLSRGWLAQREEILAFCQAGPHDGGGGALLVLMRAQNSARR